MACGPSRGFCGGCYVENLGKLLFLVVIFLSFLIKFVILRLLGVIRVVCLIPMPLAGFVVGIPFGFHF